MGKLGVYPELFADHVHWPSTPPTAAPQTTTSPRTAPLLALRSALGASPELADGQHLFLELEYSWNPLEYWNIASPERYSEYLW